MMATHQFCTFTLERFTFGLEVHAIQEVLRAQPLTPVPLAPSVVRGLINLRGQIVAAIDLRTRLGLPARDTENPPMNVIVRTPEGAVSLLVDEIGDVLDVDPAVHEAPPETLDATARELVSGVFKLPDRLLLILDVNGAIAVPAQHETHA